MARTATKAAGKSIAKATSSQSLAKLAQDLQTAVAQFRT